MNKISVWVSSKTNEIILYHETTQEVETDVTRFKAGKHMLSVFDVGWECIGFI